MKSTGYVDVKFEHVDMPVMVGKTTEDAMGSQLAIGPAGEVFCKVRQKAEDKRSQIESVLSDAINAQKAEADCIVMVSSSWVISVTNPG